MSLPQDGVNANALAETTTIPTGKKLIFLDPDTNEGGIITLENLTKQILSNLATQTFNLDQGTKTLLAALNELNSKPAIPLIRVFNGSLLETLEKEIQQEKNQIALISTRGNITDAYQYSCGIFLQAGEISAVLMVNYQTQELEINSRSRGGSWREWKKI